MLKNLKDLLEKKLLKCDTDDKKHNSLELSAAVLMLEIAMADSRLDDEELVIIEHAIQQQFHLNGEETKTLIDLGKAEVDHATSLYEYTKTMNANLSPEEKTEIIELLWRIANADVVINKYEEYYIRKVADLLYVSHGDYIKAKHKAIS